MVEIFKKEITEGYDEFLSLLDDIKESEAEDEYQASLDGIETTRILNNDKNRTLDAESIIDYTLAGEIHLHIDTQGKTAYVKLPLYTFYMDKPLNIIGNDIIKKIGNDCNIYVINNAGEVYSSITLNQLLGKEEIKKDIAEHGYVGYKKINTPETVEIRTDEKTKAIGICVNKNATLADSDKVKEIIERETYIYNRVILYGEKQNGEKFRKVGYFKNGRDELQEYIEELKNEICTRKQQNTHESKIIEEPTDTQILNNQNAIIIEKDPTTKRVDKYIYDSKTGEKTHEYTLAQDKDNMYQSGTYVNFVEFTTNLLTDIYEKFGSPENITLITEKNEELELLEGLERAFAICSQDGGMSVGDEYVNLIREKEQEIKYVDLERLYDSSTKAYNKGKIKLEKGLYMNKEKIEKIFKTLKVRIKVNENQDTTGVGQMGR